MIEDNKSDTKSSFKIVDDGGWKRSEVNSEPKSPDRLSWVNIL